MSSIFAKCSEQFHLRMLFVIGFYINEFILKLSIAKVDLYIFISNTNCDQTVTHSSTAYFFTNYKKIPRWPFLSYLLNSSSEIPFRDVSSHKTVYVSKCMWEGGFGGMYGHHKISKKMCLHCGLCRFRVQKF